MQPIDFVLHRFPAEYHLARAEALGSAGGMSGAKFWRIHAPRGTFILRRWPVEHPSPERLRFIHDMLRCAAARGISFVPVPITSRDGRSFVEEHGHLWELAPWLPGTADYEATPSREKLYAAMTALAEFHVATADVTSSGDFGAAGGSAVTRHLDRLHEVSCTQGRKLHDALRSAIWPELQPAARRFLAVLKAVVPQAIAALEPLAGAPLPLQVCIRDIWHDHVLFTGERVTGLIDFGAMQLDTPATDIARLVGSMMTGTITFSRTEPAAWQAALAAYCTIRPLSQYESRAAQALDTSGTILAGCNWLRWLYVEQRRFENRGQIVDRFGRILARLEARQQAC